MVAGGVRQESERKRGGSRWGHGPAAIALFLPVGPAFAQQVADASPAQTITVTATRAETATKTGLPWRNWSNSEESSFGHRDWRNVWGVSGLHRSRSSRSCVK